MPVPLPLRRRDWTRRIRALDASIGARVLQAYARHIAALERATAIAASNAGAERGEGLLAGQRAAAEAQRLREAIERDLRAFTPALAAIAREGVADGIEAGQAAALGMIGTQTGATLATLNSFGVAQMAGIVDSEAFRASLNRFGPAAGQKAADILLTGIASGMGTTRIAKRLRDFVTGEMRVWADATARTAMLTSFRRASHETYRANADVVGSWMWWAALDARTCMSCIAQHGTIHPLTEELTDHHKGRCSPLPIVRGTSWASDVQTGADWFERQPAGTQRGMLGPSAYGAYKRGEWDWSRVSVEYQDAVYGAMRREATLGEMGIERVR